MRNELINFNVATIYLRGCVLPPPASAPAERPPRVYNKQEIASRSTRSKMNQ